MGTLKKLNSMSVLEIDSGRGGGLNYISKNLGAAKCIGIDSSQNQVKFLQ